MKTNIIPLIIRKSSNHEFLGQWQNKYSGKPTTANLSKWRDGFNKSLAPGHANEHLGVNHWLQCKLEIYNQITKKVICSYNSPMFEVIP